jgi:chromosome segregation ATPase
VQGTIDEATGKISTQLGNIRGSEEHGDLASIHNQLQRLNSGVLEELQGLFETLNGKLTEMLGQLGENVLAKTSEDLKQLNKYFTEETSKLLQQNLKAMNASFDLQRKESKASVQQHIAQFENVNKGLHTTREKLNQEVAAIESKFTSAIDRIADSLSGQSETLKATLGEKIKEVKTSFETGVELMAEAYNEKGDEIQSTYEQVENALRGFNEQIQSNVDETLRKNLEQLEGTFKRLEELQSRSTTNLSDTTKSFTEAVDKNQQIALEQSEVLKQVQAQYEAVENLRTDMKELIDKWGKYSEKLHHLQDRVAELTNTIEKLDTANSLLQKLSQNGHTTV